MEYKLLVISNEKSYFTDSMITALSEANIRCTCIECDIKAIEASKDQADMVLLYVNDAVVDLTRALVFLKDVCADDAKSLYLAGYQEQVDKVFSVIPRDLVKGSFMRPFENKAIVTEILTEAEEVQKRMSAKKILVVDDDVTFLKMVKRWLMNKYQVTVVKSGTQAIKYLAGHRPDLILMDYEMPITNGTQVLEMIRSEPDSEDIPIIFLTGKADKETVMQVMNLKPQGYLLKSMSQRDIVDSIDRYFETEKWQNFLM